MKPDIWQTPIWIEEIAQRFWAFSPENTLNNGTGEKAWQQPSFGYARGDDPLFAEVKDATGPFVWLPVEAYRKQFPDEEVEAAELTVISWIMPQLETTKADQRQATTVPSERWARSRDFGEKFNCALRLHLAEELTRAGFPAVAPERLPDFAYQRSEQVGIASNWSERHAAYIAGLGTFGLSDGLITKFGKAVRIGSVVARINLPITERPYTNRQEWCLWYAKGSCGACIKRCPPEAINSEGHDKDRCFDYIREVTAPYAQQTYGTDATPCGLCQVKIPCENAIPGGIVKR